MRAISTNDSVQVAGASGMCLLAIANVAMNTTTCLLNLGLSEDSSTLEILPSASVMPYIVAAAFIANGISELVTNYNNYKLTSNVIPEVKLVA